MDNEQFLKAYQYAQQNPKSDFALEFAKRAKMGNFNDQLSKLGVDTSKYQAPKKKGFFQKVGEGLIKSEKGFGESIAGAIIPFTKTQKTLEEARANSEQTQAQLIKRIQEGREKGEDVSKWTSLLKDISGQNIPSDADINPALLKTNKQVLGEALGVATDIIGAGTFGKAAQGAKTGQLLATGVPSVVGGNVAKEATTFLGGALKGAKTGAIAGAGFGTAQGVATGMQEDLDTAGIATRGVTGGIVGGTVGGVLGGVTGGVSGALRGRNLRKQELQGLLDSGEISDARLANAGLQVGTDDAGNMTYKISGKDKVAKEAVKQGFDDADVALVKTATPTDKAQMSKMLNIAEKASTNRRVVERPYDVVGESVLKPVKELNTQLNSAVKELDGVAKTLKGQAVNQADDVLTSIQDDLAGMGVKVKDRIKGTALDDVLDFTGSDLEGLGSNETLIKNVWRRIKSANDAYDFHRVKRYIDSNVEFGKSGEGLTGQAQSLLKGWRKQIDNALDTQFTQYNQTNSTISDIFGVLDNLSDVLGRKFKIGDEFSNLRAGQVASRLLGNNATRGDIMNMLNTINQVSSKYGVKSNQDIISQVVFADMLEDVFGTQATRGLQGQVQRAVRDGAIDTVKKISDKNIIGATLELGKKGLEKSRGINQENKIKAIKALLGMK